MEYFVVCLVAFGVSGLTLFSGFGLGTVLMPAFALFFPVPVAVAATAVVHLANNLFKTALVGRKADWSVVMKFALPGAAAAMLGALLLNVFASLPPVSSYQFGEKTHEIAPVELVIGVLIIGFAFLDLLPRFENLAFDRKYLPVGGLLSGFFGGLSGIQGALRSAGHGIVLYDGSSVARYNNTPRASITTNSGWGIVCYGGSNLIEPFFSPPWVPPDISGNSLGQVNCPGFYFP
jgi:uncharacterized membrane protein YfcA